MYAQNTVIFKSTGCPLHNYWYLGQINTTRKQYEYNLKIPNISNENKKNE